MVPEEVRMVDTIPRLPNFKPDLVRLTSLSRSSQG
jgi:hypothetical protein